MDGEILFKKAGNKQEIVVYLDGHIYNAIERLGKLYYKDKRKLDGLFKTYALVLLYTKVGKINNGWIPIRSSLFRTLVSKRHYKEYLELFHKEKMIGIKKSPMRITNNNGKKSKTIDTTMYRLEVVGYLFVNSKRHPVVLKCDKDYWEAQKRKYDIIRENYNAIGQDAKRASILKISEQEIVTTIDICRLIKKMYSGLIKTPNTISKHIDYISKYSLMSFKDIQDIVIGLLKIIKEDKDEQYIGNILNQNIDNQNNISISTSKLKYYQDVYVSVDILDKCYCIKDLKHIIRLTKIPDFKDNGKLYTAFANLRRPLREYVYYNGHKLEEATDISCAHFTMLPIIFQMHNITIPREEMGSWKFLTQKKSKEEDKRLGLYSVVADYGNTYRDAIKPTFQSFFSLKNEKSYIYYGAKNNDPNRRIVCEFFNNNFPNIYQAILALNNSDGPTLKSVANQVESDIINPICDRMRSKGLHPFRVQDAIYLPSNEKSQIDFNIRQEVFNYVNGYKIVNSAS